MFIRVKRSVQKSGTYEYLQHRLDARGGGASWPDVMRDLSEVKAVDVTLDQERYLLRTELRGHAAEAFAAAGVRLPRLVEHLGPTRVPSAEL